MKFSVLVERTLGPNLARMDALVTWPRQEVHPQPLGQIFGKLSPKQNLNSEFTVELWRKTLCRVFSVKSLRTLHPQGWI